MNAIARAAGWPVLTLLLIGGTHLAVEAARPELHDLIGPAEVMPIYLIIGSWTAVAVVRSGAGYVAGLITSAALGLMPLILQLVGFGLLFGRDGAVVTSAGLFGLAGVTWGGAIGAGIAASLAGERQAAALPVATAGSRKDVEPAPV